MGVSHIKVDSANAFDEVAKVIVQAWRDHNNERLDWLERGRDTRSYLSATSTAFTEVNKLPWKNKTTIPKLTQIADNLISYYMAAIMPDDNWFIWESSGEETKEKANAIEEYMRIKFAAGGFRLALQKCVRDWVYYGNTWGSAEWKEEYTVNPITGIEVPTFTGPVLGRVSPYNCLMDPRAPTFDNSMFVKNDVVHITEVLDNPEYDEQARGRLLGLRGAAHDDDLLDTFKEHGLMVDGFTDFKTYLESGKVEIMEYWGDVYIPNSQEYYRNQRIIIADRSITLLWTDNPTLNKKKPYVHAGWRPAPDNLYSAGPLDQLAGMQYRCDHLENLKADAFDQIIYPMIKVKGNTVEDFEFAPGNRIYVGEEGDVEFMRPDASVLMTNNEIANYHSLMELMAGSPREMMGFRTPGEKTAFEVQVLQNGADRNFLDKVNYFEEVFITPILNLMLELTIRNLDAVDVYRTFQDRTKAEIMMSVSRDEATSLGVLRPVGAKHYAARNKRVQELSNFLQLAQSAPSLSPHMSGVRIGNMLEEELGFDQYNIFEKNVGIQEQVETELTAQVQAQAIQAQLQGGQQPTQEQNVPTEEDI